jgi:hypothetical protein
VCAMIPSAPLASAAFMRRFLRGQPEPVCPPLARLARVAFGVCCSWDGASAQWSQCPERAVGATVKEYFQRMRDCRFLSLLATVCFWLAVASRQERCSQRPSERHTEGCWSNACWPRSQAYCNYIVAVCRDLSLQGLVRMGVAAATSLWTPMSLPSSELTGSQ